MKTLAIFCLVAALSAPALANPSCKSMPDVALYHVGQHVKLAANYSDPDAAFIFCPTLQRAMANQTDIGNCQSERRAVGRVFVVDRCLIFSRPGASSFEDGAYALYHLHSSGMDGWTANEELSTSKVW